MRSRQPRQLLFAFFGEHVLDDDPGPIRASVLIGVLDGAGYRRPGDAGNPGSTRRLRLPRAHPQRAGDSLLAHRARGRGAARGRRPRAELAVRSTAGRGWTLVTFSIPEEQRTLRHHLRSTLTWAGFAPLRDGLWLRRARSTSARRWSRCAMNYRRTRSSRSTPGSCPSFPSATACGPPGTSRRSARAPHLHRDVVEADRATSVAVRTGTLVARLARCGRRSGDPRLPQEFVGEDNLGRAPFALYRRLRRDRDADADLEFTALVQPRERAASH